MSKLKPMPKYVIATKYEEPKKGSLLLLAKEENNKFVVQSATVAGIEEGDIVLVESYGAVPLQHGEEKHFLIHQDRILAIIEES